MNEQIENLYGRIGQAVVDLVGAQFRRALVHVEMADDHGSIGLFVDRGDRIYRYLTDEDGALFDLFFELRQVSRQAGLGEWSQATFELEDAGRFAAQYGFDDISDLGKAAQRREAWMERHLGPGAQVMWTKG